MKASICKNTKFLILVIWIVKTIMQWNVIIFFTQFAHTIRQLIEKEGIPVKLLNLKIKEVSVYILESLTSTYSDLNSFKY